MKFNLNTPIRRTWIANLFGVGVNLLNQIVLVPFYILYWGNDLYCDWIVLSALTAFFSMSDIGLNTVIQNRFSIKLAENNTKECNALLADNFVIITIIFGIVLGGAFCYVNLFDLSKQMNINVLSRQETNFIFLMLLVHVFMKMYSGVENAIYRATHHASRAVYFDQIGMLLVVLLTFLALLCNLPLWMLSIMMCIPNALLVLIKYIDSRKYYMYRFRLSDVDIPLLKQLALPSISFLSFPLGNAVVLQGYTLLVNKYFGADSVVLYNTTRTMCNFIKVLLSTVQNSIWPEYSISYGLKDYGRMRYLHRKSIKIAILGSVGVSIFLMLFGPFIYQFWTQHQVMFQYMLMAAYLLVIIMESLWTASSVALMATNNHSVLGVLYVGMTILSLLLAFVVAESGGELYQIVLTMLMIHTILAGYTIQKGLELTHDRFCHVKN